MAKILLELLCKLYKLNYVVKKLYRPEGCKDWGFSDTKDVAYSIYVTRKNSTKKYYAFGFWINDDNLSKAYLRATIMALRNLF